MSREEFEIVEKMDKKDLKTQLALQCAPLLTGIKPSNLLTLKCSSAEAVMELFQDTEITVHTLCRTEYRTTLFLFRETELMDYLERNEVREALARFGYQTISLIDIFENLCARYQKYMTDHQSFPHELGLLLGYPACDVLGFIENEGQNYLYSGYWKVYANLPEALAVFKSYDEAREKVIRMVSRGMEVSMIMALEKPLIMAG
ncbi:MAG: DUF3793 family protein [Roseburia sp.]